MSQKANEACGSVSHNKLAVRLGLKPESEDNFVFQEENPMRKDLFSKDSLFFILFFFFFWNRIVEKVNRTVKKVKSLTT